MTDPGSSACFLFSAESRPRNVWVGLLARRCRACSAGCFTFPGESPSGRSKQRPRSQWRDRAGFTPDFPVMPLAGTQTRSRLYHERIDRDKSCAEIAGHQSGVLKKMSACSTIRHGQQDKGASCRTRKKFSCDCLPTADRNLCGRRRPPSAWRLRWSTRSSASDSGTGSSG